MDKLEPILSGHVLDFSDMVDHLRPIVLLNISQGFALAFGMFIGRQVAETIVLEMEGDLEVFGVMVGQFDVLPLES